jgi:hypothetical protein
MSARTISRAKTLLRNSSFVEDYYYDEKVTGPWKPVTSRAYELLINNILMRSSILEEEDNDIEVIFKDALEAAFAVSGLPFYEGEYIPFFYSKKYKTYILRDVFYHLDCYLAAEMSDTKAKNNLCWAKMPAEDGKCVGPAESRLVLDAPEGNADRKCDEIAATPALTREESLLALKNMILFTDHICIDEIEFLLKLDLPESIVAILSDKESYVIPESTLELEGVISDDVYEEFCAQDIGFDTRDLLQTILEAFN